MRPRDSMSLNKPCFGILAQSPEYFHGNSKFEYLWSTALSIQEVLRRRRNKDLKVVTSEKEGNLTPWDTMDGSEENYVKWNKPVRERPVSHDFTHRWDLTNKRTHK